MDEAAHRAAERAVRASYGRLVAWLSARGGDISAAEDALADALAAALQVWPERGVPDNPDAWLLTAARRNLGHARARRATASAGEATLALLADERLDATGAPFGDTRLALMFACTHPAIDPAVQAPLMLQAVLGLDAGRIAAAFLVSPAAMGQRLVRAKAKIRDAGIAFAIPQAALLGGRVAVVNEALYAAYGAGWEAMTGAEARQRGLADEAIWLARVVLEQLPGEPEVSGLLALMLYCEARRPARRDPAGRFVPLAAQDPRTWDAPMQREAEALLRSAARHRQPGRFQVEAAIQSLHAEAVLTGSDHRKPLTELYDLLWVLAPSIGAGTARAVAHAEAGDPVAGLAQLDALAGRTVTYQPWWAARARVFHLGNRPGEACAAAAMAAGLTSDPAIRDFLLSGGLFDPR